MKKIILGIALAFMAITGFSSCGKAANQTEDSAKDTVKDSVEQVASDSQADSASVDTMAQ